MNKFFATGNLGSDPQIKEFNGRQVCSFPVAVRNGKRNKDSGSYESEWYNVSAWGKMAESCATYLKKGSRIAFCGTLSHRTYTAKDGNPRVSYEVSCDFGGIEFLSGTNGSQQNHTQTNQAYVEDEEDSLPFD